MKTLNLALAVALTMGLLANCAKKDDEPKGADQMAASCYYFQTSQNGTSPRNFCSFNYSAYPGFYNYGSSGFSTTTSWTGSMNGCAAGTQMVLSDKKGLGCVDTRYLDYNGEYARYQLDSVSGQFVLAARMTQMNYSYGSNTYGFGSPSSYLDPYSTLSSQMVLRACEDTNDPCPNGLTCRSPFGLQRASAIGVCYY